MASKRATPGRLATRGPTQERVAQIMNEMGPNVYGLLRAIFRKDPLAAHDAFSLFSENLCRSARSWRNDAPLKVWVYAMARNAAITVTRESWRRNRVRLVTKRGEQLAEAEGTRSGVRRARQAGVLEEIRETLDPDEQFLLTLRLDEQLEWIEVAQVLSAAGDEVDSAAVRKRFERLKDRLRDEVRRRGHAA